MGPWTNRPTGRGRACRVSRTALASTAPLHRTGATFVGRSVEHLFRPGSANPVRYVPTEALLATEASNSTAPESGSTDTDLDLSPAEPGLRERVQPLLDAFADDLVWAQSRSAQELFHSNTVAWLLEHHPQSCTPVLDLLGGHRYDRIESVDVVRERRQLDMVIDPGGPGPKIVVENKLYSVPYAAQLSKYISHPLPWSEGHDDAGATDTRYVLLSLMTPTFPLPEPWVHVDYADLAGALDLINGSDLGHDAGLFDRYRALVRRLVALAEAVDPAQARDEPFLAHDLRSLLAHAGLDGAVARMRYTALAQTIQKFFDTAKSFKVDGARGGMIHYERRLSHNRGIGWQFQDRQLRYWIKVEDSDLQGPTMRAARQRLVEAEHLAFFDHSDIAAILGSDLREYSKPGWLAFNPDFVYRHRPLSPLASTAKLSEALVAMMSRVDCFADTND